MAKAIPMCGCLKKRLFVQSVVLVLCAALFGQSAPESPQGMFHVSGTITQSGSPSRGNWVTFEGTSTKTVKADEAYYETDLPLGIWTATVTAHAGTTDTFKLSRPRLFRMTAPSNVVLDLFERPPVGCGGVRFITPDGRPPTAEELERKNEICAGRQFFSVPSSDGVPFEVLVGGLDHNLCFMKGLNKAACDREFATYNLLSVQADKIVYHARDGTLEASGNVVVKDEHGVYRRDSARFFIGDGRAIPVY